jgi:prephenate dehydratase
VKFPIAPLPVPISAIAYLGPVGTYGEQAAMRLADLADGAGANLLPQITIRNVMEALSSGLVDGAVVPIENSVEGGVTTCLDMLWESGAFEQHPLRIERALILPIRHALLSDGSLNSITEVLSHPQALGQCSAWLQRNLPAALQLPTSSTAEAARMVRGSRFRAAIASQKAAKDHQLEELAYPINDQQGNCTRFLLLRRVWKNQIQAPSCTSLAFSLRANAPGGLVEALQVFAKRGLNMSRIESRPSKRVLGEYVFFVDLNWPQEESGNRQQLDQKLAATMQELKPLCERLIEFGTYPVIDDTALP